MGLISANRALQQRLALFDHLGSAHKHRWRHIEADWRIAKSKVRMGRWLRLLRSDILSMFDDLDAIRSHWWIEKNLALVLVVTAGFAVVSHVAHTPLPGCTLGC